MTQTALERELVGKEIEWSSKDNNGKTITERLFVKAIFLREGTHMAWGNNEEGKFRFCPIFSVRKINSPL